MLRRNPVRGSEVYRCFVFPMAFSYGAQPISWQGQGSQTLEVSMSDTAIAESIIEDRRFVLTDVTQRHNSIWGRLQMMPKREPGISRGRISESKQLGQDLAEKQRL